MGFPRHRMTVIQQLAFFIFKEPSNKRSRASFLWFLPLHKTFLKNVFWMRCVANVTNVYI
jgi:hypothetical protein